MKKYVSLDKRSKKAQREYHAKQRRTWGELNPVTRSVPSGKIYNRKKEKQRLLRASGTCSATTEAKRRPAKNSEMDLMPIFFCKIIYFLLDYDVTCKCQYMNVQKVENKNVHFIR